jgi:gamma-glutamylcyclotransferase (GGCT)/AIG2-like uncharacterized protein YtfP
MKKHNCESKRTRKVNQDNVEKVVCCSCGYIFSEIRTNKEQETIIPTKETLFFFYGSLRKGLYNHSIIKNHSKLISKTAVINGFKLYSLGSFPCVISSKTTDLVLGEIYKINDDEVIRRIHLMEIYAKYKLIETMAFDLTKEKLIKVFVYEYKETNLNPKDKIESGDWVKEINSRKYCKYCGGEIEKNCLKDLHKKCEMYAKERGF